MYFNINHILCLNSDATGNSINNIFDTVIHPGPFDFLFTSCLIYSHPERKSNDEEIPRLYYRLVLRHTTNDHKADLHFRLDSNLLQIAPPTKVRTTHLGFSQTLLAEYAHHIDEPGNYQVDVYAKEISSNRQEDIDFYDSLSVNDLTLVASSPFEVIFTSYR